MKRAATVFELRMPSVPGFEKVAMSTAEGLAKVLGLDAARTEDLKSALAEACINAMEHGNHWDERLPVTITFAVQQNALEIKVRDCGGGPENGKRIRPDLERKLRGEESARGMGMFLIDSLVDESEWVKDEAGGSYARLVMHLPAIVEERNSVQ